MGWSSSSRFPEICENQEKLFEDMMSRYCGSDKEKVNSKMAATNNDYGLINFDSNSATFKEEKTLPSCAFHWTGC